MSTTPTVPDNIRTRYSDIFTPDVDACLAAVSRFEVPRVTLMLARHWRRQARASHGERIRFLSADSEIRRSGLSVRAARQGDFSGGDIPADVQRQWIQGTGPAARLGAALDVSLRNVAYALLSGADGWMFDGEDALGQLSTLSLDSQRNLKLALARDPRFLEVAERVSVEMNRWGEDTLGRRIIDDWRRQLDFTTVLFRPRGLHLDDRHVRRADGSGFSASITDTVLFVVNNWRTLRDMGRSIVLYLPKIQTAEEATLWHDLLLGVEHHLGLPAESIRTYVLVEQLEASFQLMEIRAALGRRIVGFNTGRWDYINSVADAMAWDPTFIHPNIDEVTMTYGYMRGYEDRVRRATNTPDREGRTILWQGGMEPQIPVGSAAGVRTAMQRAVAGAEREQRAGASGKWVAHWKMVHIVRPVWEKVGDANQLGRAFPPLSYETEDADALVLLEPGKRSVRGARDLISVAMQYANAFLTGSQAAALKPADFFSDDDVLYLMEDMATGEIRMSILWEWIHKRAAFTESDGAAGVQSGDTVSLDFVMRLVDEEFDKLRSADPRNVHEHTKTTTLPIAREIVRRYLHETAKCPWFIDLLNLSLGLPGVDAARDALNAYFTTLQQRGLRLTNPFHLDGAAAHHLLERH